ncbi:DUF4878 domain-containing protein [Phocaeicola plebeius]|uniref:DUF4878 domain-containing protein n=1 Tax=Phocaeicola plebeius TaxID=310297 RepID=UPI0026DCF42B|nr:DUF4878 domain-containing protein [Phocaeicola plebeius]
MKKITMMLIAACGILLAACSSNTPTNTVEKAFDAMIKGDYETYVRSFYVEDKSEPEKVENDIQDLVKMIQRNAENHPEENIKSYEILKEESSKTGKWVRVGYKLIYQNGKETTSDFYLTKDEDGSWKIQMFGTDKLMEE